MAEMVTDATRRRLDTCLAWLDPGPHPGNVVTVEVSTARVIIDGVAGLRAEVDRLRDAVCRESHEVEQTLGRALGYPKLYPEASAVDDGTVGVGDHVPASLAAEAAGRIAGLKSYNARLCAELDAAVKRGDALAAEVERLRAENTDLRQRNEMLRRSMLPRDHSGCLFFVIGVGCLSAVAAGHAGWNAPLWGMVAGLVTLVVTAALVTFAETYDG